MAKIKRTQPTTEPITTVGQVESSTPVISPFPSGDSLRTLIDHLPVGVIIFAPDCHVILCNSKAGILSGLNCDEITGKDARQIPFHFLGEDDIPLSVDEYPFSRVFSTGQRVDDFVLGVDPAGDDNRRWILTHSYPEFDDHENLVQVVMIMTDLSKRKQIEKTLSEEQTYTRFLMDNIPDAIYFKDIKSRFIRINKAQARFLGLNDPADAVGKTDYDFFAIQHAQIAFRDEQQIIQTGKLILAKEEKLTFPNGRINWVSSTKMPLVDPKGNIIGTFGLSYDITKRKNMENSLTESEKRFRTLFEQAAVGVAIVESKTGKFLRINQRFCDLLGYSEKELRKFCFSELTERDDIQSNLDQMDLLLSGKIREYSIEKRYIRKDGSVLYAALTVSPMWASGEEPTTHISIVQDITKRKRAEEAERATRDFSRNLVDLANAPIITWDADSHITLFNHAFETMTGFSVSEVLGKPMDILFPSETLETSRARVACTLRGEQLDSVEIPILHKDGSTRLVVWNSSNLYSEDGQSLLATIAHGQDITERFNVEQTLMKHTFELELAQNFSKSLRPAQNVEELIEIFISKILGYLDIPTGVVFLEEKFPDLLNRMHGQGWLFDVLPDQISKIDGICGSIFATQQPYVIEEYSDDMLNQPNNQPIPKGWGGICIPLLSEQEIIGVTFLSIQLPREFLEQEIRLMSILAETVTMAIKRTKLRNELQKSYDELKMEAAHRKEIQELLAREKEILSITLMSIGDGLIRVDENGTILLFNKSAEKITGFSAKDALGNSIDNILRISDYRTNEPLTHVIEYLLALDKKEKSDTNYLVPTLITKSGQRTLVSGIISPIVIKGRDTPGYVLAFRDVSEKYNNETQSALSQKMEAIGQLAAGIAHEINTPIQYIGDNINFLQRTFSRFGDVLNIYHQFLSDHIDKNITSDDISELENTYQKNKIPHYNTEVPVAIQEAQEGIDRVRKIVVAIREFSHASEHEMKLADLNRAILTTITISRNEWKYFADMETDLDPALPHVFCQIDEINQVVLNMIINASQAIQHILPKNSEQKGKIKISTCNKKGKVYIAISDTGSGIPDSIRNRIFDPFFTTKEIGKGTGQGLALAHNIIVKKHHGKIHVVSESGKGTTFTIELKIENSAELVS